MEEAPFKCLRCGHEFKAQYDKKVPMERACPRCSSNSVRLVKVTAKAHPSGRSPGQAGSTGEPESGKGDAKA